MTADRPTAPPFRWAEDYTSVGITGTNGKTSTTCLVSAAMRAAGHGVVRMGTVGCELDDALSDAPHWETLKGAATAETFYAVLQRARARGIRHAALEVTSQALAQGYAKRWRFDHAVFTNLTPDHLDAHGSWEHYLAAKAQLFVHLGPGQTAVLNAADPHALYIDKAIPADVRRCWFSSPTRGPALTPPDIASSSVEVSLHGTSVQLEGSAIAEALGGSLAVRMAGEVFAENAMAAAAVCLAAGIDAHAVVHGLAQCPPVPGRFELISTEPSVVVDFAHTPDALARTCDTAAGLARGRLIVVMGAGGDRSQDKRGPMGHETALRADLVIVTNDNPRAEDPAEIAAAVLAGAQRAGRAQVRTVLDRRAAIETAIDAARAGDVVVIAGKGHETGQIIGDAVLPFSDAEEVRRITGQASARKYPDAPSC